MVHCLIADIQTVADPAEPIDQGLPLRQIIMIRVQLLGRPQRIPVHALNGAEQRDLGLVADVTFTDRFHESA